MGQNKNLSIFFSFLSFLSKSTRGNWFRQKQIKVPPFLFDLGGSVGALGLIWDVPGFFMGFSSQKFNAKDRMWFLNTNWRVPMRINNGQWLLHYRASRSGRELNEHCSNNKESSLRPQHVNSVPFCGHGFLHGRLQSPHSKHDHSHFYVNI